MSRRGSVAGAGGDEKLRWARSNSIDQSNIPPAGDPFSEAGGDDHRDSIGRAASIVSDRNQPLMEGGKRGAASPTYPQQAYAAKLLGYIAATSGTLARRMIQFQCVCGLLSAIGNTSFADSQRNATATLLYLVERYSLVEEALKENMGQDFYDMLISKPDTYYRDLTKEHAKFLRRNTVRIHVGEEDAPEQAPSTPSEDSDEDDDEERTSEVKRSESALKAEDAPADADVEDSQDLGGSTMDASKKAKARKKPQDMFADLKKGGSSLDTKAKEKVPAEEDRKTDETLGRMLETGAKKIAGYSNVVHIVKLCAAEAKRCYKARVKAHRKLCINSTSPLLKPQPLNPYL